MSDTSDTKARVTFEAERSRIDDLEALARLEETSLSHILRQAIREFLESEAVKARLASI